MMKDVKDNNLPYTRMMCIDHIMRQYIAHHITIIETRETVEDVCNILTLCVLWGNCVELCMLLYYTTMVYLGKYNKNYKFFRERSK